MPETLKRLTLGELIHSDEAEFRGTRVVGHTMLGVLTARDILTDRLCVNCTVAVLRVLAMSGVLPLHGGTVALASNAGHMSARLAVAVAFGILHAGHRPENCGDAPVAALVYYAQERRLPAMMVYGPNEETGLNTVEYYSPQPATSDKVFDVDLLFSLVVEVL